MKKATDTVLKRFGSRIATPAWWLRGGRRLIAAAIRRVHTLTWSQGESPAGDSEVTMQLATHDLVTLGSSVNIISSEHL